MLDEVGVVEIRQIPWLKTTLGVGNDDGRYYVYERAWGQSSFAWTQQRGNSFSSFDQAVQWIRNVRE